MEPATTEASTLGTVIDVIFMVVVGYGEYLVVSDSEKRWKERYGNRWFVTPSDRERLDKEYETAKTRNVQKTQRTTKTKCRNVQNVSFTRVI